MDDWTSFTDPRLVRIAVATVGTPVLAAGEEAYTRWLGYRVVERGTVAPALARSWAAPAAAGARTCTMAAAGESDVFIRLIETPAIQGYRPLTTFGWNAFEIIVDDVHALAERLRESPFAHLAGPSPLQFLPSIVAMQVVGPGGECLYFTMESGDRESSLLPLPSGFVGRTFIVVLAGAHFPSMLRWYVDHFALKERPVRASKVGIVQQAQGLDPDHCIPLSAIGLRAHGNLLELDGYPTGPGRVAGPRPRASGQLPPGNAMVAFEVEDLAPYAELAIAPPQAWHDGVYRGRRACTLNGPAGELIELIEAA